MRFLGTLIFFASLICAGRLESYSQVRSYSSIVDSVAIRVERLTGFKCDISGTDVNTALHNPAEKVTDPYRTLTDCFIFLATPISDSVVNASKGFVGVYNIKSDSVLWRSKQLSDDFSSGALGKVEQVLELNRDGKVEILIGQLKEPPGTEQLWIFSWDGVRGKLITQLDSYGESVIMSWGQSYKIRDVDRDGIREIQGKWYEHLGSRTMQTVTYGWNGVVYGKFGKSSKRLLNGRQK